MTYIVKHPPKKRHAFRVPQEFFYALEPAYIMQGYHYGMSIFPGPCRCGHEGNKSGTIPAPEHDLTFKLPLTARNDQYIVEQDLYVVRHKDLFKDIRTSAKHILSKQVHCPGIKQYQPILMVNHKD